LKERADNLEQAYKELQEIDHLKDELVQNVSHELRTPLTFVKGYVELLLDGDMGSLTNAQRDSLIIVNEKTNALTRLVNDIIYLQRIQRESLDMSLQDLGEMARLALQSCEVSALNAGISLRLDTSKWIVIALTKSLITCWAMPLSSARVAEPSLSWSRMAAM
jgi:signal transduction histidine kinase